MRLSEGENVVYPAHGVGRLVGFETQVVEEQEIRLLVIAFEKDRMILKLPQEKAKNSGLRPLSTRKDIDEALDTLKQKVKSKRTMWSRRAQEYLNKIHSGELVAIAEVVRDLYKGSTNIDQSHSERRIYQEAIDRLVHEMAVVQEIEEPDAMKIIEKLLRNNLAA